MPAFATMLLNVLVVCIIFVYVLYPRFNRWPESTEQQLIGKPSDYIDQKRYTLFSLLYLATFALFALSLSYFRELEVLIKPLISIATGVTGEEPENGGGLIHSFRQAFGARSFVFCLALVSFALMVPAIDRIDQRWRKSLLLHARVPRESLQLRDQLRQCLPFTNFSNDQLSQARNLLNSLQDRSTEEFEVEDVGCADSLNRILLRALYLVHLCRRFSPTELDTRNLSEMETRFKEIAAVRHHLGEDKLQLLLNYKKEIDNKVVVLLEILAKNCVRCIPEQAHRHAVLKRVGFNLEYRETQQVNYVAPALTCAMWIVFASLLATLIFMNLYDYLGFRPPGSGSAAQPESWFDMERLLRWTLGSSLSFIMAVMFGVFFKETLPSDNSSNNLGVYLLSFLFATFAACVFYSIQQQEFRAPFFWLSISFGLLSAVAVASRDELPLSSREVLQRSLQLSFYYGLMSGALQVVIHTSFSGEALSVRQMLVFYLFGFCRGGAVALFVAYTLIDTGRRELRVSKRNHPRIRYREMAQAELAGENTSLVIKNLSECGASVRMRQNLKPHRGESITLNLGFASLHGKISWVKNNLAGIEFDDGNNLPELSSFINNRMCARYLA